MTTPTQDPRTAGGGTLEIPGDLPAGGPPVEAPGDVVVRGSVRVGVSVRAGGSVTVHGSVENATIVAGGDITIGGTLVGSRDSRYQCAGSLRARVITNATIEAEGDVSSELEISHSRVICGGAVRCPIGHIMGGHITANGGVVCGMLGSTGVGGAPTQVEIAIDETLRRLAIAHVPTITANLERIEKVRTKVQPLMAHLKHLSPQQKETATELLAEASMLEEQTAALAARLRDAQANSLTRAVPTLFVAAAVHPGTTIRFPVAQMIVEKPLRQPARLTCEGRGAGAKVILANPVDRSSTVPRFALYADAPMVDLQRALTLVEQARSAARKAA